MKKKTNMILKKDLKYKFITNQMLDFKLLLIQLYNYNFYKKQYSNNKTLTCNSHKSNLFNKLKFLCLTIRLICLIASISYA